ncbi:MAG TPA: glycosyltransferase family 4 protein [Myxococcales bacterium]|nr:glycosyltransferase family 4 protein [Myxococcales bacterium]
MSELRRILLASFDPVPDATGASARLTELLRGLTPVFDVDALTPKGEMHSHIERYYGARLMRVPMLKRDLPSRALTFERAMKRQLESNEYDLVHVTDPFGGYPTRQRRGLSSHRIVYDAHSLQSLWIRLARPDLLSELRFITRLRRLERHCLLSADLVLASSEAFRGHLQLLGVPADRVRIVPPPIDLSRFREAPPPPGAPFRITHLGGAAAWEGTETLLDALRVLLDQGVPARLSLAGERDAATRRFLRQALAARRLGDAVDLLGPLPHEQVPDLLEHTHVCVAPLSASPLVGPIGVGSMKVAEYLAAGRPVVAADTALHRELVGSSEAAGFFRAGDAPDLAQRLAQLWKDERRRMEMGDRARDRARTAFDAALSRRALLRAYYDLLDPSIIVNATAYAAERSGAGSDSATQAATVQTPEPVTNPALGEATTNVSRVVPRGGPLPTPTSPAPMAPAGKPPPPTADLTAPEALPDAVQEDADWFSGHLPDDAG